MVDKLYIKFILDFTKTVRSVEDLDNEFTIYHFFWEMRNNKRNFSRETYNEKVVFTSTRVCEFDSHPFVCWRVINLTWVVPMIMNINLTYVIMAGRLGSPVLPFNLTDQSIVSYETVDK
jgi:hypothetical protein